MLLLLLAIRFPFPPQAEVEPAPQVAVTASGLRVECAEAPDPGALAVVTPYGLLHLPRDPVERIEDAGPVQRSLRALEAAPGGFPLWLERCAAAGLLSELVQGCNRALAADAGDLRTYEALEAWGARLDPVPERFTRPSQRLEWLWKQVRLLPPAEAVLAGARLEQEAAPTLEGDFDHALSLADIRRGLRSPKPHVRRVAARLAAREEAYDLLLPLLDLSVLAELDAVRDAAAAAAARAHLHEARQFWTLVLAQGPESHRVAAARNLGRYGGPRAIHALVHVLAAAGRRVGERIPFVRTDIQVVSDRRLDLPFRNVGHTAFLGEVLDGRSAFKVATLEDSVLQEVLAALDRWAGEETGRDPSSWLDWYREHSARLP